jgi:hypothetical protein
VNTIKVISKKTPIPRVANRKVTPKFFILRKKSGIEAKHILQVLPRRENQITSLEQLNV